ncbi:MAG: hypothetical protein AAB354_17435 [candidate division KSB1 bacterium]
MNNQNRTQELLQRKSLLVIQAQFQQALGRHSEAARLFINAALLEEKIAAHFQQQGEVENAAISLFSAASCYKNAGELSRALALVEAAMTSTNSEVFIKELEPFCTEQPCLPKEPSTRPIG